MPVEVSCRLVFLASPGRLSAERESCRQSFRRHNESRSLEEKSVFFVHAWEDIAGGVGRPQDRINPKLDECDYVLMLLGDRWGTPPDHDGRHSSGTEEEFFRAVTLLSEQDSPMRDILILFQTLPPERLRDPGPELQAVLNFRAGIEASKDLMYETFDSLENLAERVDRKIRDWARPLDPKRPTTITLPQVESKATSFVSRETHDLASSAREFAAQGLIVQAEMSYAAAIRDDDPDLLLEFAQFMRRTGRLENAMSLNWKVAENPTLLPSRDPRSVALRVQALSNIGVIQRKQGELAKSIATLKEATTTAKLSQQPIVRETCYALDNYAISLMRAGEHDFAIHQFQECGDLREEFGTPDEQAQSAINIGRQHLALGEDAQALNKLMRGVSLLRADSDKHLVANAETALAEALILLDEDKDDKGNTVEDLLASALSANQTLQNSEGISITHGLWARFLLRKGRNKEAETHIDAVGQIVEDTGNEQGRAVVTLLRAEQAYAQGDSESGRRLLDEARKMEVALPNPSLRRAVQACEVRYQEA